MPRRIATGFTGGPILGILRTIDNTIRPNSDNENISIIPTGTGQTEITGNLQLINGSEARFGDADNTHYVGLTAPSTVGTSLTFTLPGADGTSKQVIETDASGNLSFADISMPITNDTASSTTHYPMLTTGTTGTETGITVSNSKLSFAPNSGQLTATAFSGNLTSSSVTITGGTINGTSVGASTASTGRFTSITETSSITLKENVNPIENALGAITQLAGVIYDRKDGSSKNEAGLIAEEVNNVLPNLVNKDESGNPESIQYTKLSAYLIEAVKSLKEEIDLIKR